MDKNLEYKKLIINETEYTTLFNKKFENRVKWEKENPLIVKSYIPGTVVELFVKEGTKVTEGQPIMILEAMKMRNKVLSPVTGSVEKIHVKIGEVVPKGHVMIEMR